MHDPYSQIPSGYEQYNEPYKDYRETPRFPNQTNEIKVVSITFVPTGTYQEQWRRPWTAEFNQDNVNRVYEAVGHSYHNYQRMRQSGNAAPDGHYMIDPLDLANVSSSFMKPAAAGETTARINVVNGIHNQTARFIMVLQVQIHGAVEAKQYIINGYTNHLGLHQMHGRSGLNNSDFAVDHQMELTINSIMEIRNVTRDYGYGPQLSTEMISVNQVLMDTQFTDVNNAGVIRLRPYEVATTLARQLDPTVNRTGVNTTDTRYVQTGVPELSDVHHSNPNDYMAKIISGLTAGKDLAAVQNHGGVMTPYNNAARIVRDASSRNDPLLKALANFGDGVVSASFKFRDLLAVDPHAGDDGICFVNYRDYGQFANKIGENMAVGTATSEWHGRDMPTQWAAQITNMLSPMMMDLAMRKVQIFASNLRGEVICKATNALPFVRGVNLAPQLQALDQMFYQQFVSPMSVENQIGYDLDITADLFGEVIVKLSVGGSQYYTYVFPAFCSSAMSPVLTMRPDTLDNIATAFKQLQTEVIPAHRPLITELSGALPPSGNRY